MKLLDKFKNMFTDPVNDTEEEDDIIVEQIQKDVTQVSIESPNKKSNRYEKEDDNIVEKFRFEEVEKKEPKPIFFDEEDFNDLNFKKEPERKESNLFSEEIKKEEQSKKEENSKTIETIGKEEPKKEEKKVFKPTPIISPIYGILDKNYHKEDIVSREEPKKETVEPTVDTIRNKAYGTLEDELENTLFGSNSILFKNNFKDTEEEKPKEDIDVNEDILSDLTDDIGKELDELLVKKEKHIDKNIEKKPKTEINEEVKNNDNLDEEDLLGFIDSTLYSERDE